MWQDNSVFVIIWPNKVCSFTFTHYQPYFFFSSNSKIFFQFNWSNSFIFKLKFTPIISTLCKLFLHIHLILQLIPDRILVITQCQPTLTVPLSVYMVLEQTHPCLAVRPHSHLILIVAHFIFLITVYNWASLSPELKWGTRTRYCWFHIVHLRPWSKILSNLPCSWI